MDDLPPMLILEILSRLSDSADLARCRVASKALNTVSAEVRSINLYCSFDRYTKSRSPETKSLVTPFKKIFVDLVSRSRLTESVSLGVEKPLRGLSYDDVEDESDDLHLTGVDFVGEWLPSVAGQIRSISISDFWIQSCWRRSKILSLISSCCHSLLELELKNAWLSVDDLIGMPMLTSLTLEYIRLDDEDLNKVNDCFPSLQVLNLIGVGGLKEPKIHLLQLRTCHWTVSNAPLSLTILAPNLIKLKLECWKPKSLVIDAPLLSEFQLSLEKARNLDVKEFRDLKTLQLESRYLFSILGSFPSRKTVKNLTIDSSKWTESAKAAKFNLARLFDAFPNAKSLTLGPGAWLEAETCFRAGDSEVSSGTKGLKEITAHLFVKDIEISVSFIFFVLEKCTNLTDMALLIHREVESSIASNLMSRCIARCARVIWRWGFWKEGMKDAWVSDGI
ncbi:F-box/LRR-repeat protein At4g29420 [Actinidia eriantha]|uniref:F-box/LRR-repeat protein At4g29420 n=1 Tax=Actinidia eriantha TaxID=165200 RepID=UPI00258F3EAA|nr:F-box/LRR-repeat protein At4g29420 [Actinidia eriantha]